LRYRFTETGAAGMDPFSSGLLASSLLFFRESQQLVAGSSIILLTAKEAKLLHVFANAQQETIDRDQLMKEVWEDFVCRNKW
jgi:DNA-binding winged helix-turn-helix (wHTH) protein